MTILITIISIFAIAALAFIFNKIFGAGVCPICAGVSGTWIWMLIGSLAGIFPMTLFQIPIAILAGGSVVGIAYLLEKKLPAGRSPIFLKMILIPAGFAAVYGILEQNWFLAVGLFVLECVFAIIFLSAPKKNESGKIKEIEEKMKKCC